MNFNIANTPYLYFGAGKFKKIADIELFKESERILILTGKHSFVKSESFTWLDEMMKSKNKTYLHYMIDREPSPQMIDDIVEAACDAYMELVIGIGGGSVMDAAKAVAAMLREEGSVMDYLEGVGSKEPSGSKIPMIAVPTTSGTGSEATKMRSSVKWEKKDSKNRCDTMRMSPTLQSSMRNCWHHARCRKRQQAVWML